MSETPYLQSRADVKEDLLGTESRKNWYVFYTAPRAEKVIQQDLSFQGYEVFLPITKTLRTWKNRQKKMVDQVLFPSYIFVHTEERHLHKICQLPKVTTFVHCGGKPSKINFECIDGIKRMLNLEQEVSVEPNFSEGECVRVIYGPLSGFEGILVRQKSKTRFGIQLKEINQTVFIDICTSCIEKR